jgi:hypothetical protein
MRASSSPSPRSAALTKPAGALPFSDYRWRSRARSGLRESVCCCGITGERMEVLVRGEESRRGLDGEEGGARDCRLVTEK